MDAAAARFGWRRAYADTTDVDALLTEQFETTYAHAADHVVLVTAKSQRLIRRNRLPEKSSRSGERGREGGLFIEQAVVLQAGRRRDAVRPGRFRSRSRSAFS
ncbi:hypothetical protein [Streptomyces mexicanus]|uniref:hypothetical protein n=1 Tax=Streptomyces mexicanus TaxID=178566 RepID=UPI0036BD3031